MARKPKAPKSYPSSKSSIDVLRERGFSDAAIGRAIGRDSSLVSQVARGRKPGRNLEASLDAMVQGKAVKEPPRRKSKSGGTARVRDSQLKAMRISAKDILRTAKLMEARGQRITLEGNWATISSVTYRGTSYTSGDRMLYGKGESARAFAARLSRYMKRHPNLSDREQAERFLAREFERRDTPRGQPRRKASRSGYEDLQSITISKKEGRRVRRRA